MYAEIIEIFVHTFSIVSLPGLVEMRACNVVIFIFLFIFILMHLRDTGYFPERAVEMPCPACPTSHFLDITKHVYSNILKS